MWGGGVHKYRIHFILRDLPIVYNITLKDAKIKKT